MSIAVMDGLIVSTSLLVGRNVFGHIFSSDKETVDYVAEMAPLVSLSLILDSLQGVLSGLKLVPISLLKHKIWSDICLLSFPPHSATQVQVFMSVRVVCQRF